MVIRDCHTKRQSEGTWSVMIRVALVTVWFGTIARFAMPALPDLDQPSYLGNHPAMMGPKKIDHL